MACLDSVVKLDSPIMITGAQIRLARGYLRGTAAQLAAEAGVGLSTVRRMEANDGFPSARGSNIESVHAALVREGFVFPPAKRGEISLVAIVDPSPFKTGVNK